MKIQSFICLLFLSVVFFFSCSPSGGSGLFAKKTLREKYEEKVKEDSGKNHPIVNAWLDAGERSLNNPLTVPTDYTRTGKFSADNYSATAFATTIKRGQKLTVQLQKKDTSRFRVYMDLWEAGDSSMQKKPVFIKAADTASNFIDYTPTKDEKIVIRFQQEPGIAAKYAFIMQAGPSLAFPISSTVKANIGSFWGAGRDAGAGSTKE